MNYKITNLIIVVTGMLLAGCASVSSKDTIYQGTKRYPPHTGDVKVYWKEQGIPIGLPTYEFVATVKARSTWCGITQAKFNKEVHKYIVSRAGEVGGNAVVLYCGEIGTVGECYCYGDAYRTD